jgi:hypothetical protein
LREGDLKLVAERNGDEMSRQLFDLSKDLAEQDDLSSQRREDLDRLWNNYRSWERTVRRDRRGKPER